MSVVALRSWPLPQAVALAVIALSAVGCSSESSRFTNPFSSQPGQAEATGSIPQQQQQRAPAGKVQTSALPAPNGQPSASQGGVSGGGRGMASYQPGQADPMVTGAVPQGQPAHSQPHTVQSQPPAPPPQRQAVATPAKSSLPPAQSQSRSAAPQTAQQSTHVVVPGETLMRISRQYNTPIAELARHNNIAPHTKLNIGDQIKIPAGRVSRLARPEAQKVAQPQTLNAPAKGKSEPKAQAKGQPKVTATPATESVGVATPAMDASEPPAANPVRNAANGSFRWPAKGRIITSFGPKTNGQTNDGINIALPEGTPVKAAADGTVAYAGNELKGYGNLVLVRHADGYVTAYAHAKELLVRRGDTVRRGQDIAKSGQTGNVDTPQLHFEIRKGPAPIDPMPMLGGG